ncbi:Protein of unknown function [Bacillus mycoides]|nr:Protein of unknown function [Bacillus mycoides]
MFKTVKERRKQKEQFQLLAKEVEKQGVVTLASRLDTAEEQRVFIAEYWEAKENTKTRWY